MKTLKAHNPKDESLLQQLIALYSTFRNLSPNERVEFNLEDLEWVFPLLILPISSYIRDTKSTFKLPKDQSPTFYLQTIQFPEGVTSVSEFQKIKNYIPIGVLQAKDRVERERLETCFAEMIYKILKPTVAVENAIYLPLTELITNIFDHSKKEEGYVFGQYYPTKGFLDLCIIDRGRGLATSYKEEKNLNLTDKQAIIQALKGVSVKPEKMRGFGIRISKRIICEGLKGSFILLSGKAALYSSKKEEKIFSLPGFYWQGVIIGYRILPPKKPVDITPFLEG